MTRSAFAKLMDDYANGCLPKSSWTQNFVAHYEDEAIEGARREVVRKSIEFSGELTPKIAQDIIDLAADLRNMCD